MESLKAPMGWNSWDCYGASVTEDIVRANADFMAANLRKYSWEYIVVDIQWYEPTAVTHEYHPFTELCMTNIQGSSRMRNVFHPPREAWDLLLWLNMCTHSVSNSEYI